MSQQYQPPKADKSRLTMDELRILEEQVLPEARRWVRSVPSLADHGQRTLDHWSETP
jgi:hypothetical protein